ncbi:MAG: chloride channel protein, partial [Clostridia bacterium]|nr:chloride channel protein [Clostridia bacterium]
RALPTAFGISFVWAIFLVMIAKFFITGVNIGAGIPCGVFVPVIAIGACIGAALNQVYLSVGWIEKEYCDLIVMICMAAFFTTIVRAPLTGIIMVCEFTWSFAPLLPVVIGVAIGYVIGTVSTHDGLYEELLEMYLHESGTQEHAEKEMFFVTVKEGSLAEKRCVRDILWPNEAKVTKIVRGEEIILPDADTVFHAGDILTVVCRTDAPQKIRDELSHVFG